MWEKKNVIILPLFPDEAVYRENCCFILPDLLDEAVYRENCCYILPDLLDEAVYRENCCFILPGLLDEAVYRENCCFILPGLLDEAVYRERSSMCPMEHDKRRVFGKNDSFRSMSKEICISEEIYRSRPEIVGNGENPGLARKGPEDLFRQGDSGK